jgi:hypothetical protein
MSMPTIVLDTLGKLYAHGHGLAGWCLDCSARYRPTAPAAHPVLAGFDVDMAALIAERGADAAIVGLRSPVCPQCGSARTEVRLCVRVVVDGEALVRRAPGRIRRAGRRGSRHGPKGMHAQPRRRQRG